MWLCNFLNGLGLEIKQCMNNIPEKKIAITEPEIMLDTWLGECCRQVEPEEVSKSRSKIHQTTYQPLFPPL